MTPPLIDPNSPGEIFDQVIVLPDGREVSHTEFAGMIERGEIGTEDE